MAINNFNEPPACHYAEKEGRRGKITLPLTVFTPLNFSVPPQFFTLSAPFSHSISLHLPVSSHFSNFLSMCHSFCLSLFLIFRIYLSLTLSLLFYLSPYPSLDHSLHLANFSSDLSLPMSVSFSLHLSPTSALMSFSRLPPTLFYLLTLTLPFLVSPSAPLC